MVVVKDDLKCEGRVCWADDDQRFFFLFFFGSSPPPLTSALKSRLVQTCATLMNNTEVGMPAMQGWCGLDSAKVALQLRHSRRLNWKWNTATGTSMGAALKSGNTGETGLGSEADRRSQHVRDKM